MEDSQRPAKHYQHPFGGDATTLSLCLSRAFRHGQVTLETYRPLAR